MANWVGPTIAISVALIALSFLVMAFVTIAVAREAREKSGALARELTELRQDLAPTLASISRLGDTGADVFDDLRDEVGAVIKTSQDVRRGVHKAVRQAEGRLADLDALLEVATEEAESALMDASAAIQSVRTSAGLLSHIGRFLAPQEEEFEEEEEEAGEDESAEEFEELEDADADDEDVA